MRVEGEQVLPRGTGVVPPKSLDVRWRPDTHLAAFSALHLPWYPSLADQAKVPIEERPAGSG